MDVALGDILDLGELEAMLAGRYVHADRHDNGELYLLNYTAKVQYERVWNTTTRTCRGLVVAGDPLSGDAVVVARPFAKFANLQEHHHDSPFGGVPDGPFEVLEKLDGSLAILFRFDGCWQLTTRGSFKSEQGKAATALWRQKHADFEAPEGATMLFEYVGVDNRIVVRYEENDLVFLGAIDNRTGADVDVTWHGRRARRFDGFSDFDEVVSHVEAAGTDNAEGFVVRFAPNQPDTPSTRLKLKLAEYKRLHRLVTGVSSISIWENLAAGVAFDEMLERVPDEFYTYVTTVRDGLQGEHDRLVAAARTVAGGVRGLSRKDAASIITDQKDVPAGLVFAALDDKDISAMAWRMVRPEHDTPSRAGSASAG